MEMVRNGGHGRLKDIERGLESFAQVCQQAERAAAAGDIESLFELAFMARQLRHNVAAHKDVNLAAADPKDFERVISARRSSLAAQTGDELLQRFHERDVPNEQALLADPLGVVSFTETMLPTIWNYEEDLVLLFGNGLDAPAEVLHRVGQKRLCVYLPEDAEAEHYGPNVHVVHSQEELFQMLSRWAPRYPKRVVSKSLGSDIVSYEVQREIVEATELYLGYVQVDRNTSDAFSHIWIRQGLANLPKTVSCPSVATFAESFSGKPMIIVAPGPSLSKNIKELHKFKGKAIICTFSHTLSAFAAEGLAPDLVMTVDSNSLQYHFKNYPMENVEAMVSGGTVYPELFEMPAKRHVSMGANAAFDAWLSDILGEDVLVLGGGSVSTSAMALAGKWKCDPVICVGLDLSFPGGRYYVETSCDGGLTVKTKDDGKTLVFDGWSQDCIDMRKRGGPISADVQATFELDGYHGGKVPTSQMFWLFHDWFEKYAESHEGQARLFNCTEGGAYIKGMEHLPLAEVYDRYISGIESFSVGDIMDAEIAAMGAERRERAVQGVQDLHEAIRRTLSLVGRCESLARAAYTDDTARARLDEVERGLIASLQSARFISVIKREEIELAYHRASEATDIAALLDASLDLYRAIKEAASEAMPLLQAALQKL